GLPVRQERVRFDRPATRVCEDGHHRPDSQGHQGAQQAHGLGEELHRAARARRLQLAVRPEVARAPHLHPAPHQVDVLLQPVAPRSPSEGEGSVNSPRLLGLDRWLSALDVVAAELSARRVYQPAASPERALNVTPDARRRNRPAWTRIHDDPYRAWTPKAR